MTTQSSLLSRTVDDPTFKLTGYSACHLHGSRVDETYQKFINGTGLVPDLESTARANLTSRKAIFLAVAAKDGGTETFADLPTFANDCDLAKELLRKDTYFCPDLDNCSQVDCAVFAEQELRKLSEEINKMDTAERRGRILKACGASDPRTQSGAGFDARSVALGALGTILAAGFGLLAYPPLGQSSDGQ